MRFRLMVIILLAVGVTTYAQETFKGEHFIEVTGSASMEIEPDEIYVFVRLREYEVNKSKVQLEKLDQDFLAALKAAGIDKKNLTLSGAGSQLGKLGKRDKDAFREKSYELKLSSATELERFVEKAEPVKIEHMNITRLSHSNMEKFKIDLKIKALQAAQTKAQTLLKAIGSDIGKPLMVRDWDQELVQPQPMYANVMMRGGAEADMSQPEDPTEFKKLKLRAQITAQFEIK
jgi:uncharacterized protein